MCCMFKQYIISRKLYILINNINTLLFYPCLPFAHLALQKYPFLPKELFELTTAQITLNKNKRTNNLNKDYLSIFL